MPSIRSKISWGFYAFIAIIAFLALAAYIDLRYLEQRIGSGLVVYDFLDAVLEFRLQEKSFFLTNETAKLQSAVEYAQKAERILVNYRQAFSDLRSDLDLRGIEALLHDYNLDLSRLSDLVISGQPAPADLENSIRLIGDSLTATAESLAGSERAELGTSVSRSQWALLLSVIFISLLGVAAGRLLSKVSLRPLAWLESEMAAIGDGRYDQLEPVSRDLEIVSISRAVNRMLNDIEKRNRHLMQSEKLVSLGTLASGVAHELNNPLSNISSSCQILLEEIQQESQTNPIEWLEQIDRETERARLIVQTILEFSRKGNLRMSAVRLHDIIDRSLILMRQNGAFKIETRSIPKDLALHADAQKLQQVFINLFQNARDSGGVNVEVQVSAKIEAGDNFRLPDGMVSGKHPCTTSSGAQVVLVEVTDSGPGIAADVLPKVFDPFFTTKDVGHGDGLGLYVTQEIIDLHGGCIGVDSPSGMGARFLICLPAIESGDDMTGQPVKNAG